MLTPPECMIAADIQSDVIRFSWDEWSNERPDQFVDKGVEERLNKVSIRANAAFVIGVAEWIVFRLSRFWDTSPAWDCLEAAWAQIVDFRYSWRWSRVGEWAGPVQGPVRVSLERVAVATQNLSSYEHNSWAGATLSSLAEAVINPASPYKIWADTVLCRLENHYAIDPEEKLGEPVPRQVIEIDKEFHPEEASNQIDRLLRNLDSHRNFRLHDGEAMLKYGFPDTPYRFDSARERRRRLDW